MIRIFLLVILLAFPLWAVPVTQMQVTPQDDRVAIALSFEAPFTQKVIERREGSQLYLLLEGVSAPLPRVFTPQSPLIESIRTHPTDEGLIIHVTPHKTLQMEAERIRDGQGLKLTLQAQGEAAPRQSFSDQLGANRPDFTENYLYMGLFLAILILLWVAIKLFTSPKGGSWLTGKSRPELPEIVWQKPIDAKNRIIQLRFKGMNYLILIGQGSNLLIDQFAEGQPVGSNAFDELLNNNATRLSDYLKSPPEKVRF